MAHAGRDGRSVRQTGPPSTFGDRLLRPKAAENICVLLHWNFHMQASPGIKRHYLYLLFFACSGAANAKDAEQIINDCWGEGAHPAMTACVARHARAANRHLADVDVAVRNAISADQGTKVHVSEARKALEASVDSFRAYRRAECGFRESIARMSNAADSVKTACEAELDEQRAILLQKDKFWLE